MPDTVLMRYLRVALALTSTVSAMTVTPANATDASQAAQAIELSVVRNDQDSAMMPISHVVPLTVRAADDLSPSGLSGQLFHATDQSALRLTNYNIAYINCDPDAYQGNLHAASIVDTANDKAAIAVLFFSTSANYCNVTDVNPAHPFLYSMINATTSQRVLEELETTTSAGSQVYFARIQPSTKNGTMSTDNGSSYGSDAGSQSDSNPLGPSPSTAVAMIILYSITGVITTLFLVIIITGALRAHRHPERYGPGVVLNGGRNGSRQTRVRGIARAMLDTLPVVKFGDQQNANHEPKPTDVEMGDATSRNSAEDHQQHGSGAVANGQAAATTATSGAGTPAANNTTHSSEVPRAAVAPAANSTPEHPADADAGIAPAAAGSSAENLPSEGDGCTICTEEFEPGQDVRLLPCNHKFHPACIDPWLLNVSGTCPLCRINLNPAGADGDNTNETSPAGNITRRSASILAPPLSPLDASAMPSPASAHRRSVFRDMLHLRGPATEEERMAVARRMAGERDGNSNSATENQRQSSQSRLSAFFLHRDRSAEASDEERPRPPPQEPLR